MLLSKIFKETDVKVTNDIDIKHITFDSRKVEKDYMFIAINGFEKDGHNLNVSVAGQFGEHHHKAYGTVNYKKDNIAVSATGNYDFDMKVLNANVRGAYKSLKSGMVYIIQGTVINEKYSVTLAAGKNGIQGFVAVENITPSQNKAPEFTSTPTISAGISYNWSVGRKL